MFPPFKRLHVAFLLSVLLAACVQPIQPTPTFAPPTVTPVPSPTPPPTVEPTLPADPLIAWLFEIYGVSPTNFQFFKQLQVNQDNIVGYTFTDSQAQTCVGWALTTLDGQTIWNGDYRCLAGLPALAGSTLFALTNNEVYVITFGYLNPETYPTVSTVAATFPNSTNVGANDMPTNGGFIILQQGFDFPIRVDAIDQSGNTVESNLPIR